MSTFDIYKRAKTVAVTAAAGRCYGLETLHVKWPVRYVRLVFLYLSERISRILEINTSV